MLTDDQVRDICDGLSSGLSLRQICRDIGIAESNARRWIRDDPEIMAQTVRARDLGHDALADQCIEIADNDTLDPQDRRVRIDTRLKLLGKWSQRYGDKNTTELIGAGGGPVNLLVNFVKPDGNAS